MDRNQTLGLVLMLGILLVYFQFFAPDPPERLQDQPEESETEVRDDLNTYEDQEKIPPLEEELQEDTDSLLQVQLREQFGPLASAAQGEEKLIEIENESAVYIFSNRGGTIRSVILKNYKDRFGERMQLIDEKSSHISLLAPLGNLQVDLSELYFESDQTNHTISGEDSLSFSYRIQTPEGKIIKYTYQIFGEGYQFTQKIEMEGFKNLIREESLILDWRDDVKRMESELKDSRNRTTINYYTWAGKFKDLSATSSDMETKDVEEKIKWFTVKQKFFSSGIIAEQGFLQGSFSTDIPEGDTTTVKNARSRVLISLDENKNPNQTFTYFFGPNKYQILKKVEDGFSRNVDLGWFIFALVNKVLIIPVFNFLENYIANYGLIILILVLFVKLLLSPLSYKAYISMAKTKVLKPQLDELKEKYKDDQQKFQSEQMALYRQVGINPLSGCIPMLLQMPILLAMFNFFPNSIELRQESFLWAHDLSTYDSILSLPFTIPFYGSHVSLFCLLMTLSTILYTWSNSQVSGVSGPMKTLQYVIPFTILFFLNSYSAGLTYYYFLSNIVTFGQQAIIRRFVDDEKIKAVLEENKLKNQNKKKSKFQLRLEQALKKQEEAAPKAKSKKRQVPRNKKK